MKLVEILWFNLHINKIQTWLLDNWELTMQNKTKSKPNNNKKLPSKTEMNKFTNSFDYVNFLAHDQHTHTHTFCRDVSLGSLI